MYVNGEQHAHRDGLTLHGLLAELQVEQGMVVVMHGDEIYRAGAIPDVPGRAQLHATDAHRHDLGAAGGDCFAHDDEVRILSRAHHEAGVE